MISETEEIETAVLEETADPLENLLDDPGIGQEVSTEILPASTQVIIQDDFIARLASDPNVNVEKMQAIIDMKMQVMDYETEREATRAYNIAWIAFRKELGPVIKNRKNEHTGSMYADLDAVKKVVDPLLAKHGFADRYEDETLADGRLKITCEIVHEAGHVKRNSIEVDIDNVGIAGKTNKTKIHGILSSMTTGQRITLCRACGIRIAKDDDGNAAGRQPISAKEMVTIREYLKKTNSQESAFLDAFKIEALENLNSEQLKTAMIQLKTKVKRQKEEQEKSKKAATKKTDSCKKCDGRGFIDSGDVREPCTACSGKVPA